MPFRSVYVIPGINGDILEVVHEFSSLGNYGIAGLYDSKEAYLLPRRFGGRQHSVVPLVLVSVSERSIRDYISHLVSDLRVRCYVFFSRNLRLWRELRLYSVVYT